jgi:hypothetical protein
VLFTGAVVGDPYGEVPDALRELGVVEAGRPVQFHEKAATFDRDLQESLLRGSTLPLEYAREHQPLIALLREALTAPRVQKHPSDNGVVVRLLEAPRAVLAIFVNETAQDAQRRVTVAGHAMDVAVAAGRSRLMLFDRATGKVIADMGVR